MKEYLQILKRSKLFAGLTDEEILSALNCLNAVVRSFKKGAYIFQEGSCVDFVGIVLSGEIETLKVDFYGNANIVSKLYPSEVIAAAAAYSSEKRVPFDIKTACDTQALCLNTRSLVRSCNKACSMHSKILENMLGIIADKNIQLGSKIDILTKRTIREKILSYLSSQSKKARGERFAVSLSRQQMADFLSINRSALSRELSKMRDEGILDFESNYFRFKK